MSRKKYYQVMLFVFGFLTGMIIYYLGKIVGTLCATEAQTRELEEWLQSERYENMAEADGTQAQEQEYIHHFFANSIYTQAAERVQRLRIIMTVRADAASWIIQTPPNVIYGRSVINEGKLHGLQSGTPGLG